jgi:hypothetical protein
MPFSGPKLAAVAVAATTLLGLGGCALLVGDVDGHHLFIEPDGQSTVDMGDAWSGDARPADDGGASPGDTGPGNDGPEAGPHEDGAGPSDTGAGSSDAGPGIRCWQHYCGPGEICCESNAADRVDGGACSSRAACVTPSYPFFCTTSSDCTAQGLAGYDCCATIGYITPPSGNLGFYVTGASCVPSCSTVGGAQVDLCDPGDPASIAKCEKRDAGCRTLPNGPALFYACGP